MSDQPLPSSFDGDADFFEESRWQKFSRRLKEEPLIPFGCALTCYALLGATRSIRAGDSHRTNKMFRARIYAQAFTLVAMVGGSYYYAKDREKRKVFEGKVAERKASERRDIWIRELEARDREDQEIRARKEAARMRAAKAAAAAAATAATATATVAAPSPPAAAAAATAAPVPPAQKADDSSESGEPKGKGVLKAVKELSKNG